MLPYLIAAVVAVPVLFLLGDLFYSLTMRMGYRRWEAGIERDAEVCSGCREFTLGEGADAVLLVHGFGDSPSVFQRLAPALADKGFTCRGLRLPAVRLADGPLPHHGAALWRDAVRAAIAELRRRHRRVFLLAHSLGAAIAVEAVADPAAAVDGMVLLAPLFDVSNKRSPLLPGGMRVSAARPAARLHGLRGDAPPGGRVGQKRAGPHARGQVRAARRHPRAVRVAGAEPGAPRSFASRC